MKNRKPQSGIISASNFPLQTSLREYRVIGMLPPAQAAALKKLIESGELVRRLRRAARDLAEPTPGEQLPSQRQPPAKTHAPAVQPLRVSANKLCECLGISRRTLGDWMRKKIIPYEKIGGRVFFDVADVDRALRRFRTKAVGD